MDIRLEGNETLDRMVDGEVKAFVENVGYVSE